MILGIILIGFVSILQFAHCGHETSNLLTNVLSNELCEKTLKNYDKFITDKSNALNPMDIRFVLKSFNKATGEIEDVSVAITNPELLWTHSQFKQYLPLVLYIPGFGIVANKNGSFTHSSIAAAYAQYRPEVNFVTIDTEQYRCDDLKNFHKCAINTIRIGDFVYESLLRMMREHPTILTDLHLIGHGYGAHLAGKIGRNFYEKLKIKIPRITALDPAGPCFYRPGLVPGLTTSDARFVDAIHTNPGTFGFSGRVGHVDFFPNGADDVQYAKGCEPGLFDVMMKAARCSHARAYHYYAETVIPGNQQHFLSTNLVLDQPRKIDANDYPMGYAATASYPMGRYYLNANADCPYGNNLKHNKNTAFCRIYEKK